MYIKKFVAMLNKFLSSIKNEVLAEISNIVRLDADKLEHSGAIVNRSFVKELAESINKQNFSEIAALLKGKSGDSTTIEKSAINKLTPSLIQEIGMDSNTANDVAQTVIPFLATKFGDYASQKELNNEKGLKELINELISDSMTEKFNKSSGLESKFGF